MPRNRSPFAGRRIDEDVVPASVPKQGAALGFEEPYEISALQLESL
jgi:hypothetical protein